MSEGQAAALYRAAFTYTEDILGDFEALYLMKRDTSPAMRVALGLLGLAGCGYFGWMLYRDGLQLTRVGYMLICSIMLVIAFSGGRKRPDDSLAKYRKYYLNRGVTFAVDDAGVEMRLEGQKNAARSKFKEIYGLFDTDRCLYFVIRGKAYYIISRDAVEGGADALMKYMEKKCAKRFQHFDVSAK